MNMLKNVLPRWLNISKQPNLIYQVGIDIGSYSLKVVVLSRAKEVVCLEYFRQIKYKQNAWQREVCMALQDIYQELINLNLGQQSLIKCQIALKDTQVAMQRFEFKKPLIVKEIEAHIVPWVKQKSHEWNCEVIYDFDVKLSGNEQEVLLVMADARKIRARCEILLGASFRPTWIDLETFALVRGLNACQLSLSKEKIKYALWVDIGFSQIAILILQHGQIVANKNLAIPAEEQQNSQAKLIFVLGAIQAIDREYFSYQRCQSIWLAGGSSLHKTWLTQLKNACHLPLHIANPFQNMAYRKSISEADLERTGSLFVLSLGLALSAKK